MQTTSTASIPSTKAPSAGRKAAGPAAGGEGDAGIGVFAELIAQAGEQLEATRQPSANDTMAGLLALPLAQAAQAAQAAPAAGGAATADALLGSDPPSPSPAGLLPGGAGREGADAAGMLAGNAPPGASPFSPALDSLAGPPQPKDLREGGIDLPAGGAVAEASSGEGRTRAGAAVAELAATGPAPQALGVELSARKIESARHADLGAAEMARRGFAPAAGKAEMALAGFAVAPETGASGNAASGAGSAAASGPARFETLQFAATATIAVAAARPAAAVVEVATADRSARNRGAAADVSPMGRRAHNAPRDGATAADTGNFVDFKVASALAQAREKLTVDGSEPVTSTGTATAAGSADASVFALTMNQLPQTGTLAATRLDSAAHTAPAGATHAAVDVPVDHPGFSEAFARQSANLIVQGSSSAEIRLTPQDMGPIRIAISMQADGVSLDIVAANADTRAAIEASLPALRQMLADDGVRLSDWRLGREPGTHDRSAGAGEGFHRHGEPSGGNGDAQTAGQQASETSHAGNTFGGGRGTSQFGRQGAGWTGGTAEPTAGALRDRPAPRDGRSSLDLYA